MCSFSNETDGKHANPNRNMLTKNKTYRSGKFEPKTNHHHHIQHINKMVILLRCKLRYEKEITSTTLKNNTIQYNFVDIFVKENLFCMIYRAVIQ